MRHDWRNAGLALSFCAGVLIGWFVVVPFAHGAPLSVHAHRLNLQDDMLAVRVYATVQGPGTANVWIDGFDSATHSAGYKSYGFRQKLHKGDNRIARTVFVQRLEQYLAPVPTGWDLSRRYWDPARFRPSAIDGVSVEVWVGGRRVGKGQDDA